MLKKNYLKHKEEKAHLKQYKQDNGLATKRHKPDDSVGTSAAPPQAVEVQQQQDWQGEAPALDLEKITDNNPFSSSMSQPPTVPQPQQAERTPPTLEKYIRPQAVVEVDVTDYYSGHSGWYAATVTDWTFEGDEIIGYTLDVHKEPAPTVIRNILYNEKSSTTTLAYF